MDIHVPLTTSALSALSFYCTIDDDVMFASHANVITAPLEKISQLVIDLPRFAVFELNLGYDLIVTGGTLCLSGYSIKCTHQKPLTGKSINYGALAIAHSIRLARRKVSGTLGVINLSKAARMAFLFAAGASQNCAGTGTFGALSEPPPIRSARISATTA